MNDARFPLEQMTEADADAACDAFYAARPAWITGSLSHFDARFLFKTALHAGVNTVIEIGTASGFSTALLCHALSMAHDAGRISGDFKVVSYDVSPNFYADLTKKVGDAAREQLSPEMLAHITFRNPARAADVEAEQGADTGRLLFIDAAHVHPWPTLDLLATLDFLQVGATVVLHDINLPVIAPKFPDWGVKYLFDELERVDKQVPNDAGEVPNIGSIRIPPDKDALRRQLMEMLYRHPWQMQVDEPYLRRLGVHAASVIAS